MGIAMPLVLLEVKVTQRGPCKKNLDDSLAGIAR